MRRLVVCFLLGAVLVSCSDGGTSSEEGEGRGATTTGSDRTTTTADPAATDANAGSSETPGPRPDVVQTGLPATAEISRVDSALPAGDELTVSPTGWARVVFDGSRWCHEAAGEVSCVEAGAQRSTAHGLSWRRDETAIAVTDLSGPISVIDVTA